MVQMEALEVEAALVIQGLLQARVALGTHQVHRLLKEIMAALQPLALEQTQQQEVVEGLEHLEEMDHQIQVEAVGMEVHRLFRDHQ